MADFILVMSAAVFFGYWTMRFRAWLGAQWFLVQLWRWHSGHTWNGDVITDAGWFRPGTKAFTPSGHAIRWHYRPRWERALRRTGFTWGAILFAWGYLEHRAATVAAAVISAVVVLAFAARSAVIKVTERKHRKTWLYPLHKRLANIVSVPLAQRAESWIEVAPDRSRVRLALPSGFPADPKDKDRIVAITSASLALEAPEVSWKLAGPDPFVVLSKSQPPPSLVPLGDVMEAVDAAKSTEFVIGIGKKGALIKKSLSGDAPHIGVSMGSGAGKALALDTLIPTPAGWTTMGQVSPGDVVFDERGSPCSVVAATEVMTDRPCYEVEFSDGSVIIADAAHQWLTETHGSRKQARRREPPPRTSGAEFDRRHEAALKVWQHRTDARRIPRVVTTDAIAATLHHGQHLNHSVRVAAPMQAPHAALPVPPYTLGAWLGDGTSRNGSITSADPEVIHEIESEGEAVRMVRHSAGERTPYYTVLGLMVRLRGLGVLRNKHIPLAYLRSSENQRRALLAGLLDTDGYCDKRGRIEFTNTNERLAREVRHLACTLGYKATMTSKTARLYGKDCGTAWIVRFTTSDKVFRLSRKLARQVTATRATALHRYITAVRPISSVPVRCIEVDSPSRLYLAGESCIPTHNSVMAAFLIMQWLHKGGIALVLDAKWLSHTWLIGMPNVAYARTTEELHAAMCWLSGELDRRNKVALTSVIESGSVNGVVTANVGPRLLVVGEELNVAMGRLKTHWAEIRDPKSDPKTSPALTGFAELSYAGRQVKMHGLSIGQMLTARATGQQDSSVRESMGIMAMSRYTKRTWEMLAPQHPMPLSPTNPGRIQLVTARSVQEVQVPLIDLERNPEPARDYALSGIVTPCPAGMPGRQLVTAVPALAARADPGPDLCNDTPVTPLAPGGVSLREAVEAGLIGPTLAAVRVARHRDGDGFPDPVGYRSLTHLYDPLALAEWGKARRS